MRAYREDGGNIGSCAKIIAMLSGVIASASWPLRSGLGIAMSPRKKILSLYCQELVKPTTIERS